MEHPGIFKPIRCGTIRYQDRLLFKVSRNNHEQGNRQKKAQELIDRYKNASRLFYWNVGEKSGMAETY